jgi:histone deacetylase 1/2
MDNANSKDYLEKIKNQVIENLKKTAHVPSVQMTEIPRTNMLGGIDEDEDILDDLDEDENKDVRHTKRTWDSHVERDDEFYESDDEAIAAANGVRPQNGTSKRQRNITTILNTETVASDVEMDSGIATPNVAQDVGATAITEPAIEANAEVNTEPVEKKPTEAAVESNETGPSSAPSAVDSPKPAVVDNEGDVEMGDEAPANAPAAAEPVADVPNSSVDETMAEATESTIKEEGAAEHVTLDVEGEAAKEEVAKVES